MKKIVMDLAMVLNGLNPEVEVLQDKDHFMPQVVKASATGEVPKVVQLLYDALEEFCSDDVASVALMCSGVKPQTCEEIAASAKVDPEKIRPLLEEGGVLGLIMIQHNEAGELSYFRASLLPGLAETLPTRNPTVKGAIWLKNYASIAVAPQYINTPLGRGGFRVMPVKESIRNDQRIASYDEIVPYIEGADVISVADCACRTSAKLLGEGCEHTYHETCIQTGPCAESFIHTGRGRQITKQEALDILKECERNGLVHQFMPVEKGKSMFLCNCCGCSCIGLKTINLMNICDCSKSNFVAKVNPDNCVGCGACVEACNMNALSLGNCLVKEAPTKVEIPDIAETEWTEEYWDKDWLKRRMVNKIGTSPCKTYCPAHISVQGYINKASQGKFGEALKVIKRDNPFPAVCGRICPHNCETECSRAKVDEAIAIDDIKKYIADKEMQMEFRYVPKITEHYNQRIAVIGAGPAGLSCAYYAASYGFKVTVFEKQEKLGGMLTTGIPTFRLEKDVINAEIDVLRELGVQFKTGIEVGKDVTLDQLRSQGFNAFYIAIGAQNSRRLGVEGENLEGVCSGIDFLRKVNLGKVDSIEGDTIVIGGGNVAIDVARAAVRLGKNVKMFCLEKDEEMPTVPDEKNEALAEGIQISNSWGPKRILGEDGRVSGVEFMRCISVFDENGRFTPKYDESETIVVPCSNVYTAIGQSTEWGNLLDGNKELITPRNTLRVDAMTYQSDVPDVFAGGDAVSGPKFSIDAIASGKAGAISLQRYLLGLNLKIRREREYHALDKEQIDTGSFDRLPRQRVAEVNVAEAKKTFSDTRAVLTDEQIKNETSRCLGCGVTVVDEFKCLGCGICATKCEFEGIKLVRRYDIAPTNSFEEYGQKIGEYVTSRMTKIAAKKQKESSNA